MRFVVDVQPLAPGLLHVGDEALDECAPNSLALGSGMDRGVEEERVISSIPDGVNDTNEYGTFEGSHPADAEPRKPV
jgi:hypothetical protein